MLPFTFHWNEGDPPALPAVAVNVTGVPEHTVVAVVEILKVGEVFGLTVMVTAFDVAVEVVAHAAFEVSTQVTISLFASDVLLYVLELAPTLLPFTFHW